MTADEIRRIAYQHPFKPFRVRLTTGEVYEIRRTLRTTVAEDRLVLGINEDPKTGIAQRMRMIPLTKVAAVEEISAA